jgi:hypothetical protein
MRRKTREEKAKKKGTRKKEKTNGKMEMAREKGRRGEQLLAKAAAAAAAAAVATAGRGSVHPAATTAIFLAPSTSIDDPATPGFGHTKRH